MAHLITEGLFHLYYDFAFFALSITLWQHAHKTGSQIAKYLSLSFLNAGIEYMFLAMMILFLSNNLVAVKWFNSAALVFCILTIGYGMVAVAYIIPKVPIKPLLATFGVLSLALFIYNIDKY